MSTTIPVHRTGVRTVRLRCVSIATLLVTLLSLLAACGESDEPDRIFGLSSQGPNGGVDAAEKTARLLDQKLGVINVFEAWEWKKPLPISILKRINALGAIPAITWEPWYPERGATQPTYALRRITAGDFDPYIAQWAKAAAAFDQPIQIRFAHEMNGSWYPWSVGVNSNTAGDYRDAYRHVHDMFVRAGATKVQWVWSIDAASRRPQGLAQIGDYYPGDQYVDVVGVDGYNGGPTGVTWDSPEELFGDALDAVNGIAPTTPVWIYETGSGDRLGDKSKWIADLVAYLKGTRVTGLLWFNFSKDGEQNWLIDSSPEVEASAKNALADW